MSLRKIFELSQDIIAFFDDKNDLSKTEKHEITKNYMAMMLYEDGGQLLQFLSEQYHVTGDVELEKLLDRAEAILKDLK